MSENAKPLGWQDAPDSEGFWYVESKATRIRVVSVKSHGGPFFCEGHFASGDRWRGYQWFRIPTPEEIITDAELVAQIQAVLPTDGQPPHPDALMSMKQFLVRSWPKKMRDSLGRWLMGRSSDGEIAAAVMELPDDAFGLSYSGDFNDVYKSGFADAMRLAKATVMEAKEAGDEESA